MPNKLLSLFFLLFLNSLSVAQGIFSTCQQMVVVISPGESSVAARMGKFEREGSSWKLVGEVHPVNLGQKGLAWGKGMQSAKPGIQKKEGDLRSPAGIFRFESAFGYAPAEEVNFKLNYIPVTDANICVEDSHSKYYNQIVDINKVEQDWADSESMLRKDEQYKWGIFVKQNVPAEADCGSCIFFHLWKKQGAGTLGCTAMTEENMLALLRWLDPAKKPLLLQMTEKHYREYARVVELPRI